LLWFTRQLLRPIYQRSYLITHSFRIFGQKQSYPFYQKQQVFWSYHQSLQDMRAREREREREREEMERMERIHRKTVVYIE